MFAQTATLENMAAVIASFGVFQTIGRLSQPDVKSRLDTVHISNSSAAGLSLLDRRAGNSPVGAIDAAVPGLRFQKFPATFAVIEPLAGIGRHGL